MLYSNLIFHVINLNVYDVKSLLKRINMHCKKLHFIYCVLICIYLPFILTLIKLL
jgi:hypothetical protein